MDTCVYDFIYARSVNSVALVAYCTDVYCKVGFSVGHSHAAPEQCHRSVQLYDFWYNRVNAVPTLCPFTK